MKKYLLFISLSIVLAACGSGSGSSTPQEERIDSVINVRDTSMVH